VTPGGYCLLILILVVLFWVGVAWLTGTVLAAVL
jgi:hypothetical protein